MSRTEHVLEQGKALVRAIESLETIGSSGPFETSTKWLLLMAYRHRLRAIVAAGPAWVAEEILSASEGIADDGPVQWISPN
jgi:hypothetical protein